MCAERPKLNILKRLYLHPNHGFFRKVSNTWFWVQWYLWFPDDKVKCVQKRITFQAKAFQCELHNIFVPLVVIVLRRVVRLKLYLTLQPGKFVSEKSESKHNAINYQKNLYFTFKLASLYFFYKVCYFAPFYLIWSTGTTRFIDPAGVLLEI